MKEDVLEVLLYIFEHFADDDNGITIGEQSLIDNLEEVGFTNQEVSKAIDWLDGLLDLSSDQFAPTTAMAYSTRVYSDYEKNKLKAECRGFLHFLEQMQVLDAHTREMVIDRALAFNDDTDIDLDRLKWVVMMVLFNMPGRESEFAWLENWDSDVVLH